MQPELGIIEGFYGRPWGDGDRKRVIRTLAPHGFRFYMYAPKAEVSLRKRWREPFPSDRMAALATLSGYCREVGVRFGVGLSPYGLHEDFSSDSRDALARKLAELDAIGIQDLGILFDDMRGDIPDLAGRQVEIVEWITARTSAQRTVVCPSYYTDDPVLDRVFGKRPEGYLGELGRLLDPSIEIFWTGEEVCSREISVGHLERVAEEIRRKPFLWDNYPVNDGQRMSQYLHLRGFTGRSAGLATCVGAHAINPALQPTLSLIPALTLVEAYREGDRYAYGEAFRRAAHEIVGAPLAELLRDDLLILQDVGLDRLGDREKTLRERYALIDHPAAQEVIEWLDGGYRITDEIVRTQ